MAVPKISSFSRRIKYYFDRIKDLDYSGIWRNISISAKKSKRPKLVVLADVLYCVVKYDIAFTDYSEWDFHAITGNDRATFMTTPKANYLSKTLNNSEERTIFSDKVQFNQRFKDFIGRDWIDLQQVSFEQFKTFVASRDSFMAKVPDSLAGKGIEKYFSSEISDFEELHQKLLENRQFLLEEVIVQHPELAKFSPTSVNTLRITSYFDGEKTHILNQVLKLGNGGVVDNFKAGGMSTLLSDDGVVLFPAIDDKSEVHEEHPLSKETILGFQIPNYSKVIELVTKASKVEPKVPYIGWDVAITAKGPVLVEGNPNSGIFQSKASFPNGKTGLLPRYREVFGNKI